MYLLKKIYSDTVSLILK